MNKKSIDVWTDINFSSVTKKVNEIKLFDTAMFILLSRQS